MEHLVSSIVVTGEGYTPQTIGEGVLQKVSRAKPSQVIVTPILAVASYAERRQILVQPERLEVKIDRPAAPVDEFLGRAMMALTKLWPAARNRGAGLNLLFGELYNSEITKGDATTRLVQTTTLESIFGTVLTGSEHVLRFPYETARINLTVSTDALIDERPGIVTQVNVHHEPIDRIGPLVEAQQHWYELGRTWSERIIYG